MNLADVPKSVMPVSSAKSNSALPSRMERRSVVQHQRRFRGERRDQPVPHHPAAGREVEDAIAGADVAVQLVLLQVLEQRAAGAVHDALRHAGRAGRIEDVERMVEREAARTRAGSAATRGTRPTRRPSGSPNVAAAPRYGTTTTVRRTDGSARAISATRASESCACRRRCSRRRRRAPSARSGRTDRARPARRSPASTMTRRRRSQRRRALRRSFPAGLEDNRRRDRRGQCPHL